MQSTRKEIMDILKKKGKATIEELSSGLGLTPTCVRQHMAVLERDALITVNEARTKLGRPHYVYGLTERGEEIFPKSYHILASWILDEIEALDGKGKVRTICEHIGKRLAETYSRRIGGTSLVEKVTNLSSILNEEGSLAKWESTPEGFLISEYNCRYQRVAEKHPMICLSELCFLNEVLGTKVTMTECLLKGDVRCSFLVRASP